MLASTIDDEQRNHSCKLPLVPKSLNIEIRQRPSWRYCEQYGVVSSAWVVRETRRLCRQDMTAKTGMSWASDSKELASEWIVTE